MGLVDFVGWWINNRVSGSVTCDLSHTCVNSSLNLLDSGHTGILFPQVICEKLHP
jgi:hypothetical protein